MSRRSVALIVASLACLALAGCASSGGGASCASPTIEVEPARAAPRGGLVVRGKDFSKGCDDTGPTIGPSEPLRGVRLVFGQGPRRWELATVDAGRRLSFEARVFVPEEAGPGRAVVRAAWPTDVQVGYPAGLHRGRSSGGHPNLTRDAACTGRILPTPGSPGAR